MAVSASKAIATKIHGTKHQPWLTGLLARRPTKVAAIALANKLARMAWVMMARNERYKEPAAALERNVCVPGHHGYPRALDLIRDSAPKAIRAT